MRANSTGGEVRVNDQRVIIGEPSPLMMKPTPAPDSSFAPDTSPVRIHARATGRIVSVNISSGGVPKLPVTEARLGPTGLEGDSQRHRRIHGGPMRALCMYSLER